MSEQTIELIEAVLGFNPYVLIECKPDSDPDNRAGFTMAVRAGGGIGSNDEITSLLLLLVEQLTGVDTDLYIQQVDVARRAAGGAPLSDGLTP